MTSGGQIREVAPTGTTDLRIEPMTLPSRVLIISTMRSITYRNASHHDHGAEFTNIVQQYNTAQLQQHRHYKALQDTTDKPEHREGGPQCWSKQFSQASLHELRLTHDGELKYSEGGCHLQIHNKIIRYTEGGLPSAGVMRSARPPSMNLC